MRDTKAIEEGNGRRKVGFLVNAEARMSEAREGGRWSRSIAGPATKGPFGRSGYVDTRFRVDVAGPRH